MLKRNNAVFLASLTGFSMVIGALVSQHFFGMEPCFKCIHQRFLVLLAAILLFSIWCIMINSDPIKKVSYHVKGIVSVVLSFGALYSTYLAYNIASDHLVGAKDELGFLFSTCTSLGPFDNFPVALDEMLPSVFAASGSCSGDIAKVLGIEMPYYVMAYSVLAGLVAARFIVGHGLEINRQFHTKSK